MTRFSCPLTVTKLRNRLWQVAEPFEYLDSKIGPNIIKFPVGIITDFASIPRPFWVILPPDGQYAQAAVLHDYLCEKHLFTWQQTHKLFLEAMEVLNVPKLRRQIMFKAVWTFGPRWTS